LVTGVQTCALPISVAKRNCVRPSPPAAVCSTQRNRRDPNRVFSPGPWIKRDSAYRSRFVVVEYRWHPLSGKKLPLFRRTNDGTTEVVHVDVGGNVSRELPAWMVDAAICQRMDLGPPLVSIGALNQLRAALVVGANAAGGAREFVSSFDKENELVEATTKGIKTAVGAGLRPGGNGSIRRERTTGDGRVSLRRGVRAAVNARPGRASY